MEKLNMHKPTLLTIEAELEKKKSLFLEVILHDLLLSQIMKGESSTAWLQWILPKLEARMQNDLLIIDMEETYVPAILEVKAAVRAMRGLMEKEVVEKLTYATEVTKVKDATKVIGKEIFTTFAKGLEQSEYFSELLKSFVKLTTSVGLQKDRVEEVRHYIAKTSFKMEQTNPEQMLQAMKDLAFLISALPEGTLASMQTAFAEGCKKYWSHFKQLAVENHDTVQQNMSIMPDFLMEASICFPLEAEWTEAKQFLAEYVQKHAGEGRIQAMLAAVEEMATMVENDKFFPPEEIPTVREKIMGAEGLELIAEQKSQLQKSWDKVVQAMEKELLEDRAATSMWELAECMQLHLEMGEVDFKVQAAAVALRDSKLALEGEIMNMDELLVAGKAKLSLASLMRCIQQVHDCGEERKECKWAAAFLERALPEAEKLVDTCFCHLLEAHAKKMEETKRALEAFVGPTPWNQSLKETADWEAVEKVATDHGLLDINGDKFDGLIQSLVEVPLPNEPR